MVCWRSVVWLVSVLATGLGPAPARAQEATNGRAWIQIAARADPTQARAFARAFGAGFGNVEGYRLRSGWYAIVLGPYPHVSALQELPRLRAEGRVPGDSFVTDGAQFTAQYWPPEDAGRSFEAATSSDPSAPTDAIAQAQRDEIGLSRSARIEVQDALRWFGFYAAPLDGAFGPASRSAIAAWQSARNLPATGYLNAAETTRLLGEYRRDEAEIGLRPTIDSAAGIAVDLPLSLVEFSHYEPPFARYRPRPGSGVEIWLISAPGGGTALAELYRRLTKMRSVPTDGHRQLTARDFTIEGTDKTSSAVIEVAQAGENLKGYALFWTAPKDPSMADQMARILAAMRHSFRSTGPEVLTAALVPVPTAQRREMLASLTPREPVATRSGFFVDAHGMVATATDLVQDCRSITIDGDREAEIAARDDGAGLLLLRPREMLVPLAHARLRRVPLAPQSPVAVAGYPFGGALPRASLTYGASADGSSADGPQIAGGDGLRRLDIATRTGDIGGPVFDEMGGVVGVLLPQPREDGRLLPPKVQFARSSAALARLVDQAGGSPSTAAAGPALPPRALARLGSEITVLVSCWR